MTLGSKHRAANLEASRRANLQREPKRDSCFKRDESVTIGVWFSAELSRAGRYALGVYCLVPQLERTCAEVPVRLWKSSVSESVSSEVTIC